MIANREGGRRKLDLRDHPWNFSYIFTASCDLIPFHSLKYHVHAKDCKNTSDQTVYPAAYSTHPLGYLAGTSDSTRLKLSS